MTIQEARSIAKEILSTALRRAHAEHPSGHRLIRGACKGILREVLDDEDFVPDDGVLHVEFDDQLRLNGTLWLIPVANPEDAIAVKFRDGEPVDEQDAGSNA